MEMDGVELAAKWKLWRVFLVKLILWRENMTFPFIYTFIWDFNQVQVHVENDFVGVNNGWWKEMIWKIGQRACGRHFSLWTEIDILKIVWFILKMD